MDAKRSPPAYSQMFALQLLRDKTPEKLKPPTPQLTLHDIQIGRPGPDSVRARSLGVELALGPLMRGDWRASELHLAGPRIALIKLMQATESVDALRARVLAYLASKTDPELCDILIARGKAAAKI